MNTKSVFLTIFFSLIIVSVSGALLILAFAPEKYTPGEEVLNIEVVDDSVDVSSQPVLVGGNVVQGQTQTAEGAYYCTLTAKADAGYSFGYWQNGTIKLSGDSTITLSASSVDALNTLTRACSPVFVSNENVFEIADMTDFAGILVRDINNDATSGKIYKLTADIFNYSTGASPISLALGVFRGIFDGNNHSIGNIYINGAGMFEALDGAVVKDIILSGSVNSNSNYAGGLCGSVSASLVSRCLSHFNIANTAEEGFAGGIVGVCSSASVRSMLFCCGFYGSISANTADQMIGSNLSVNAANLKACAIFKPKYNGAIKKS